jgi:hypothetical protein
MLLRSCQGKGLRRMGGNWPSFWVCQSAEQGCASIEVSGSGSDFAGGAAAKNCTVRDDLGLYSGCLRQERFWAFRTTSLSRAVHKLGETIRHEFSSMLRDGACEQSRRSTDETNERKGNPVNTIFQLPELVYKQAHNCPFREA